VTDLDITGSDWGDLQNDLVVADYFEMRDIVVTGGTVNKLARNRELQRLTRRNKSSIEWKRRNISGVLDAMGIKWLTGFRPSDHYQEDLANAVKRALDQRPPELIDPPIPPAELAALPDLVEGSPPPRTASPPVVDPRLKRVARHYNQAERDARNRTTGSAGEVLVLKWEKARLTNAGKAKLAADVEWTSDVQGDGLGYDIISFNADGTHRFIEVKTTTGGPSTPFYISRTELKAAEDEPDRWWLYRVHDLETKPEFFILRPPLAQAVSLQPESWKASF
jgi:hypothetical protein